MVEAAWNYPALEKVLLGVRARAAIVEEAERLCCDKVFLVTSGSVAKTEFFKAIAAALGERLAGVFDGIRVHGPLQDIVAAANAARVAKADLIVAIGGGTAIDASKVVTTCLHFGVDTLEKLAAFRGFSTGRDPTVRPPDAATWVRMIAIPTTLSAAEFTWWGGGLDTDRQVKEPYAHQMSIARTIILDPEATLTASPELFLSSGIKALDHAAERLTSSRTDALSDARCLHSLRLLARGLPRVHADPDDLDARRECQTAMAIGMASPMTGVGVGASHAVGHALGGHSGVQHGLTSCVMLPSVMRWNLAYNAERQAMISEAMGRPGVPAADVIEDLVRSIGLPHRLRDVGAKREDFLVIAEKVMVDHSIGNNIRQPKDVSELVELLEMAW